jgi:hypothetical protein
MGLTLAELEARIGAETALDRRALKHALADEIDAGRVILADGRYRLRVGALRPEVARALRLLQRPDTAELANGSRKRPTDGRLNGTEKANLLGVTGRSTAG